MNDPEIRDKIQTVKDSVDLINSLMAELHEKNVEIRIQYVEASKGAAPSVSLWRAIEHVDYLKD